MQTTAELLKTETSIFHR